MSIHSSADLVVLHLTLGNILMNDKDALAARVAVLENYVVVLAAMVAVREGRPVEEATHIYNAAHDLAVKRYRAAQPGPERENAERALSATHSWYERLRVFLVGDR